ncbi:MAG: prolipoprotein diacylglyceryl transferase [Actinobacteria bacterium]|nr:prolipoprotein diacylglyceryl transferase [Actinomycetota bacterium]
MLAWPTLERIPLFADLAVSPHGISIALGILVGLSMLQRRAGRHGIGARPGQDTEALLSALGLRLIVGGIIGARLFYVLNQLDVYATQPLRALAIWEGGLTLLGGIVGGILLALPLVRRERLDLPRLGDAAGPGLAVGIAIGRLGDLAIGEHLGPPTTSPFGWRCTGRLYDTATNSLRLTDPLPPTSYPTGATPAHGCFDVAVHQTALYDTLAMALLAALLLGLERRTRWPGLLATVTIGWYALFRLLDDVLRADRRWAGLTASQWTALAVLAGLTVALARWQPWRATSPAAAADEDPPGEPTPRRGDRDSDADD